MTDKEGKQQEADVNAALLGMPVTQSRRHRGQSQADYLEKRAGRETLDAAQLAGITRFRYRRMFLFGLGALGVLAAVGAVLYVILSA